MKTYKYIEIDLEVYKEIINRAHSFEESHNEILRRVLGLDPEGESNLSALNLDQANYFRLAEPAGPQVYERPRGFFTKGVLIPEGAKLRGSYKGEWIAAIVLDGAIELRGRRFNSLSGAAMHITKAPVNGWNFWEMQDQASGEWKSIGKLRNKTH